MPYSKLSVKQIQEFLSEQPKMMSVPGVVLVMVEFIGKGRSDIAVVATIYAGNHQDLSQLPVAVAGLPVVVKVEDRHSGHVVETIDPRENGGTWPRINGHR